MNEWFPSLDLEPTTLNNYRYMIEVHILPKFGDRALNSLTLQEITSWEKALRQSGLSQRTASDVRSTLATVLADAIPRHLQSNPAARKRGKGRKGLRRIARIEKQEKVWPSPLHALLLAERASTLSGSNIDFVMTITIAYTAMRWGEALGLPPECVRGDALDIHWKIYELNGRFYRGRPKDGSMRTADLPPFLSKLLTTHVETRPQKSCQCRQPRDADNDVEWCTGANYVFLGPQGGHFRRSNYSERVMRPAADGLYPARKGREARAQMPVLVNLAHPWPGKPLPPWPHADPADSDYTPPAGRGRPRITDDDAVASWLAIQPGLTPHGLRHGHQTWMEELGTPYILVAGRMGHEVPGMRGTYGHVSDGMRTTLKEALQVVWERSLTERLRLSPRSTVPVLDAILQERQAT